MAIWFTDRNLTKIAEHQHDLRLQGSITELAQIMSNIHRRLTGRQGTISGEPYPLTLHHLGEHRHRKVMYMFKPVNNPIELWATESTFNYGLLYSLWLEMQAEHHYRFNNYHPSYAMRFDLRKPPRMIKSSCLTCIPKAEGHQDEDSIVESYQCLARRGFTPKQRWTKRTPPTFLFYDVL